MEKQPHDGAISGAEDVLSAPDHEPHPHPHPHPNSNTPPKEGLVAWLQVVGAFCVFLNTW